MDKPAIRRSYNKPAISVTTRKRSTGYHERMNKRKAGK